MHKAAISRTGIVVDSGAIENAGYAVHVWSGLRAAGNIYSAVWTGNQISTIPVPVNGS